MNYELNETTVRKVIATVDAGLTEGIGKPIPGRMCVEAAVCYAMGLPHSDRPVCVGDAVRAFAAYLNDACWSSNAARAAGMRKLAVAQLGSERIDQQAFANIVTEQTIRRVLPFALRAAAKVNPAHAESLEAAATCCESEGVKEAAEAARKAAYATALAVAGQGETRAAYAAIFAADAAEAANNAAKYAIDAANDAICAANATTAAGGAAEVADAAANADYAARAAAAAADTAAEAAANAAYAAERDHILRVAADIGLQALITLKSPGCNYLRLCDEVTP